MLKILFLNHNVVGRSTYQRCFAIAQELAILGHQVSILTNSQNETIKFREYKEKGVYIAESPDLLWGTLRTGWDPINVIRRCIYLADKKFDLIHAFDTRPTVILPALFYKKFIKNIPLFIDWSDWWGKGGAITLRSNRILNTLFSPIETFFEEYFRKFATYSTVASKLLFDRALSLDIKKGTITLLPNYADTRNIYPGTKEKARKSLNLPLNAKICVYPSFVLYDFPMVLQSFKYILSHISDSLLILAGEFPEYFFDAASRILIKKGIIKIVGKLDRDKLRLYLNAGDAALVPISDALTNRARFPMKFGDCFAAGIPVITNKVGEIGDIIAEYRLGLLCDYSPTKLGEKAIWVFHHQKEAEKIAQRAREFAETKFSWKIGARLLESKYKLLTAKS